MERMVVAPIGGKHAGWLTGHLSEVRPLPALTPLPEPYPYLSGTAFLGGRVVTVLDTFPLLGEEAGGEPCRLLLRLAPPLDHLAFPIPSILTVIDFQKLDLREEGAGGVWAGLYPFGGAWIHLVHPPAVSKELALAMAYAIHPHPPGREDAS